MAFVDIAHARQMLRLPKSHRESASPMKGQEPYADDEAVFRILARGHGSFRIPSIPPDNLPAPDRRSDAIKVHGIDEPHRRITNLSWRLDRGR
jgi:hypothetical protein